MELFVHHLSLSDDKRNEKCSDICLLEYFKIKRKTKQDGHTEGKGTIKFVSNDNKNCTESQNFLFKIGYNYDHSYWSIRWDIKGKFNTNLLSNKT